MNEGKCIVVHPPLDAQTQVWPKDSGAPDVVKRFENRRLA